VFTSVVTLGEALLGTIVKVVCPFSLLFLMSAKPTLDNRILSISVADIIQFVRLSCLNLFFSRVPFLRTVLVMRKW
jgi:hypothetical protein